MHATVARHSGAAVLHSQQPQVLYPHCTATVRPRLYAAGCCRTPLHCASVLLSDTVLASSKRRTIMYFFIYIFACCRTPVRLDGKFRKVRFSPPEFKVKYYSEPKYKGISENTLDVSSRAAQPAAQSMLTVNADQLHVCGNSSSAIASWPVGESHATGDDSYCITASLQLQQLQEGRRASGNGPAVDCGCARPRLTTN